MEYESSSLSAHLNRSVLDDCPQCRAPAEVLARWAFESTDGPIEHVKIRCVLGHWFAMPAWMLPGTSSRG